MRIAAVLPLLAGCAQLLGLDETKFDPQDAAPDAPSVCDGAPRCVSTTGRSVCGQLFDTGERAGLPLRAAAPTGEPCVVGSTEGPCALAVAGMPKASFFGALADGRVDGTVDDCGRFVVLDLDVAAPDIAVVFTGTDFQSSATLVLGRPGEIGEDRDVAAYAVSVATATAWAAQLSATETIETGTGYLVQYTTNDMPLAGEQVAKDNSSALTNAFGTVPWAAYFSGPQPFGTLDPDLTATAETGTALAVLGGGTFSLDGFRTGRRCKIMDLQQVGNTLIHVIQVDC